ncbi:TonB family protein [Hyphomicrobium sp. LHD-15]|uniref:TonB family protein n=1 Tax=Hyphomicrobium sp. LHD-15 TaxID=3072142 RepID=UPI00280DFD8C|nr:TonB family protein [Hyphomicrobium sp. LHD-15]MDQ8698732.1 TonB family protein [Hyphomicrobium sp. LHD-15]
MMMHAEAYFEPATHRLTRWSSAASMVVALHVAAGVVALMSWPTAEPKTNEPSGAVMMDLPSLAAESPSDQQELSEQPQFQMAAPPPSPADIAEETPPEASRAAEAQPEPEPTPEKVAEIPDASPTAAPTPEPLPEMPDIEEAPLAPEPEVTLPKKATPEPEAKPAKPKQKIADKANEKDAVAKSAQKSNSKQQQQAAASSKGKFDPNPVYRASPAYPTGARAQKIEGNVVVAYSVSASGAVSNVRVVSASPPGIFNSATIAAVQKWRFKPSPQGAQGRRTTVRFKLR